MKKNKTPGDKRPVPKIDANAELFAAWTYRRLLNGKDSTPYPLEGASVHWQEGSNVKLEVPPPAKEPEPPKPLTGQEAFGKIKEIEKLYEQAAKLASEITACGQVKSWLEAKQPGKFSKKPGEEMTAAHKKELLKICSVPIDSAIIPIICSALFKAICDAQDQLVRLADVGIVNATQLLFDSTYIGANELLMLSRRNLKLVQHVARTQGYWPVNYSPHHEAIEELETMIDRLGVGKASSKREDGKWSNKPAVKQAHRAVVGHFANSMFWTLDRINRDGTLRRFLKHNPPGWPAWACKLVELPPITKTSAPAWFYWGFKALTEAARGSVGKIPKLRPVGEASAKYQKDAGNSVKIQEQQRAKRIRESLRAAFLERFGP